MSTVQWYLLFHLLGAFTMAGGALAALAAAAGSRSGEAPGAPARIQAWAIRALLLPGAVLALIFGLLLIDEAGYDFGDGWISASLTLWIVLALAAEGIVGRNARSDSPTRARALWGSAAVAVLTLVIIILMVWRPGS